MDSSIDRGLFEEIGFNHDGVVGVSIYEIGQKTDHWLADGFHRYHGARKVGLTHLPATIHNGTRRHAILFSVGANADQRGMRRTNVDKHRSVKTLLEDEEWSQRSDNWIATTCGVSHPFVSQLRPKPESSLATVASEPPPSPGRVQPETQEGVGEGERRRYITKHGTEATMKVSRIGRTARAREDVPSQPPTKKEAIIATLEQDRFTPTGAIAEAKGVSVGYVSKIRSELGIPATLAIRHQGVEERANRFDATLNSFRGGYLFGLRTSGVEDFADDPRAETWVKILDEGISDFRKVRTILATRVAE